MNQISLDNLSKYTKGNNKGNIDWIHNVGQYVDFTYKDISDKLLIKSYNPHNQYITIVYNNHETEMFISNFKKGNLGKLFDVGEYKYKVNQIVNTKNNKFKILSQTYLYHGKDKKEREKSYLCECLTCGYKRIIREHSLISCCSCIKCGDSASYPEKFMINVLDQLDIKIEVQKTFKWSNRKRYDIYIPSINTIIEVHGGQHYEENFYSTEDEKENDQLKQKLANDNNINNYIIIDSKQSTLLYMKKSILKSDINKIYDLKNINWNECHKFAQKSYIKEICQEWNKTNHLDVDEIAKKYHRCKCTIQKYLKIGNDIGLCTYDKTENHRIGREKANKKHQFNRPVICITTGKRFESQKEATDYYNIYKTGVSDCCCGRIPSAGKDPITGKRLIWKYVS